MTTSDIKRYTFNIIYFFTIPYCETAIHYLMGIKLSLYHSLK